jgi:hypothetical protein
LRLLVLVDFADELHARTIKHWFDLAPKVDFEAKNPGNVARGFTTVPIGAPCPAGHITLPQYRLLCGRDLHCGKDDQTRCR